MCNEGWCVGTVCGGGRWGDYLKYLKREWNNKDSGCLKKGDARTSYEDCYIEILALPKVFGPTFLDIPASLYIFMIDSSSSYD